MLKKTFKTLLATTLIAGGMVTSSPLMAGPPMPTGDGMRVGGSFNEFFGQYDSGINGESARLENRAEANIKFTGAQGPLSAFAEVEVRDTDQSEKVKKELFGLQRWVQFKKDAFSLRIGTIVNLGTIGYTVDGGIRTSSLEDFGAVDSSLVYAGFTEADGIRAAYQAGPVNLSLTLYGSASALQTKFDNKYAPLPGQSVQFSAFGGFGPLGFRTAFTTETLDDPTNATDKTMTNTYTHLGVKYRSGKMAVAYDYASATIEMKDTFNPMLVGKEKDHSSNSIQVSMAEAGPGKVIATYALKENKLEGTKTDSETDLNLVYDIPLAPFTGAQIIYLTRTNAPEVGDAVTSSFIGGGLYARF